jgi:hypothetical protein
MAIVAHAQTYTVTTFDDFEARIAEYESAAGDVIIEVDADLLLGSPIEVKGSNDRMLTIRSTSTEVRTLKRDTPGDLFTVNVNASLILEGIIIDGGNTGPGPEPAEPAQCVDSQNRLLFCQWDTGCFSVNNEHESNRGKTCREVVAECNRWGKLFYDIDPESLTEENGYGADMQCNAIGGKELLSNVAGSGPLVRIMGGKLVMNDGAVLRNNATALDGAGGVYVNAWDEGSTRTPGKFEMNGGEIIGNSGAGGLAGGVHVQYSEFTMDGGKISGNDSTGVTVAGGAKFIMNDGEISNNVGRGGSTGLAGGVHMEDAEFTMNGGKISGNTSTHGSGVSFSGTFIMNDGEISGNTATYSNGGGVMVFGTFEMNGGKISENTSVLGGAGVFVGINSTFTMIDGEISRNATTNASGGGVFVNDGKFTMTGGEIIDNTASHSEGVVFGSGVYNEGEFTMNGGLIAGRGSSSNLVIFAYGGGTNNINQGTPGNSVIITYPWPDNLARHYTENTSTDLIGHTGTTAVWAMEDDKHGISYSHTAGGNSGFIEMSGVNVIPPSAITKHPDDIMVLETETAKFSITASPINGATSISNYQWQVSTDNGATFSNVASGTGGTTATYTTPVTTMAMNGYIYRCVVTDNLSVAYTSLPAKLTVRPLEMVEDFERELDWRGNLPPENLFGAVTEVAKQGTTIINNALDSDYPERARRMPGGHDGSGHHGEIVFSNMNAASNVSMRVGLDGSTGGYWEIDNPSFELITGFTFWAKADKPMTMKFNVFTAEDYSNFYAGTHNMYAVEVPITAEWKQYTVNIFPIVPVTGTGAPTATSHGEAGDLRQENGRGEKYTFDRTKIMRVEFEIRGSLNPGITSGTFYIDQVSAVCDPQVSISTQPTGGTVIQNTERNLTVAATTSEGTLSYQWYSNTAASNTGGTAIPEATAASYAVPTDELGTYHYYVVVTNTVGEEAATIASSVATINVVPLVNAQSPHLGRPIPPGITITVSAGQQAVFEIQASSTDGGTVSTQWYSNTTASNTGGTAYGLPTGGSGSIAPPTTTPGTFYYYAIVTNTNNSVNGNKTASITTEVVTLVISDNSSIKFANMATGPNITAKSVGNTIILQNVPSNTKVELYNLRGELVYTGYSENSQILKILVQTKGMYIAKVGNQTLRVPVMW